MLPKPSWNPSGAERCQKVTKMNSKVIKKVTLKWEWTRFCKKNADLQFDPLLTIYSAGRPSPINIIVG